LYHPSADVKSGVMQAIRAGFEYQGQKCSALSRCYVPKSKWTEFERILKEEVKKITVGPPTEWQHFVGPVIGRPAFEKITGMITKGKEAGGEIITGGTWDDSKGFYVQPTVILTKDPKSVTMTEEIFGPVITVYVYDDAEEGAWEKTCQLIDTTTEYALTGAVFSADRTELIKASNYLRNSAGNFYLNDKCTGAVVSRARECHLRQFQTDLFFVSRARFPGRSTTLRWSSCVGYQRQVWIHVHLLPIRLGPIDQGELWLRRGLCLPFQQRLDLDVWVRSAWG
jgi:1-pyrroline-5-carboxylate dehydrogenase